MYSGYIKSSTDAPLPDGTKVQGVLTGLKGNTHPPAFAEARRPIYGYIIPVKNEVATFFTAFLLSRENNYDAFRSSITRLYIEAAVQPGGGKPTNGLPHYVLFE